jgi:hypothetical protein
MDYLALPTRTDKDGHSAIDYNQLQLNEIAMLTGKAPWTPIATPAANPPTGKYFMYFKSDGKLYKLNEDGDEAEIVAAPAVYTIDVYIGAGGGGGGGYDGGGGGAGGAKEIDGFTIVPGQVYTATPGAGGAGAAGGVTDNGAQGSASSFDTETTTGGGRGVWAGQATGGDGGSGGAGGYGSSAGGGGVSGEGNNGGTGVAAGPNFPGGGGGGKCAVGTTPASGSLPGIGGVGIDWKSLGTYYAGGGGGGCESGTNFGNVGGNGGGGRGWDSNHAVADGSANTGGGGGGGGGGNYAGGAGGSGVIILKILTAKYSGVTTGSPTVTTAGSYTYVKFTGLGTYTG